LVSIKNLINIASKLDKAGYYKYSNEIDRIIKKVSQIQNSPEDPFLMEPEGMENVEEERSVNDFFTDLLT
jgi:hypothetical protein